MAMSMGSKAAFVQAPAFRVARPAPLQVVTAVKTAQEKRKTKHMRIRQRVSGTEERPRLAVFRSSNHIYCQVIDDVAGNTLAAASTLTKEVREALDGKKGANTAAAELVGKRIAEVCAERGITKVCFDRAGFKYHGRVKAIADAAREAGLDF